MSAARARPKTIAGILGGVSRVAARRIPFRPHRLQLDAPLISFSFDDFPLTAATNAAPILEAAGMRGTFYYAGGLAGKLENGRLIAGPEVAADLATRGHEIGAHTHNHLNVQRAPADELHRDVTENINEVYSIAQARPASFAYPYGVVSLQSKFALAGRFSGLRGIETGINHGVIDLAHLLAQELYDASSDAAMISAVLDEVERVRGWLIFYTHDVEQAPSSIGCSPAYFSTIVEMVRARGLKVATVADALTQAGVTRRQ